MSLTWTLSQPAPDPFEAITGDQTECQVHFAECTTVDPAAVQTAIAAVVKKALGFYEANKGERCQRLLFLWDVVYAMLTVVYTDGSMMLDARHVTKCYFVAIDKQGTAKRLSKEVCRMIESSVAQDRHGLLPATMHIFYSDQDRASVGAATFKAQQLSAAP